MRAAIVGAGTAQAGPILAEAEAPGLIPAEGALSVPSGQEISLEDVVWDAPGPGGLTVRFRFVTPAIGRAAATVDFDTASADMAWLCQNYALPRLPATGPQPSQIVISLSDRAVPFGEADPEATQFFEAYRVEDGACIWEMF